MTASESLCAGTHTRKHCQHAGSPHNNDDSNMTEQKQAQFGERPRSGQAHRKRSGHAPSRFSRCRVSSACTPLACSGGSLAYSLQRAANTRCPSASCEGRSASTSHDMVSAARSSMGVPCARRPCSRPRCGQSTACSLRPRSVCNRRQRERAEMTLGIATTERARVHAYVYEFGSVWAWMWMGMWVSV